MPPVFIQRRSISPRFACLVLFACVSIAALATSTGLAAQQTGH